MALAITVTLDEELPDAAPAYVKREPDYFIRGHANGRRAVPPDLSQ